MTKRATKPGPHALPALTKALRSLDWSERMRAIEVAVARGEVRLRNRLWLLSRFHIAPAHVRAAAARAVRLLDALAAEQKGRVSPAAADPTASESMNGRVSDPATGRVSLPASRSPSLPTDRLASAAPTDDCGRVPPVDPARRA